MYAIKIMTYECVTSENSEINMHLTKMYHWQCIIKKKPLLWSSINLNIIYL